VSELRIQQLSSSLTLRDGTTEAPARQIINNETLKCHHHHSPKPAAALSEEVAAAVAAALGDVVALHDVQAQRDGVEKHADEGKPHDRAVARHDLHHDGDDVDGDVQANQDVELAKTDLF
jgi:hypothetical protein